MTSVRFFLPLDNKHQQIMYYILKKLYFKCPAFVLVDKMLSHFKDMECALELWADNILESKNVLHYVRLIKYALLAEIWLWFWQPEKQQR